MKIISGEEFKKNHQFNFYDEKLKRSVSEIIKTIAQYGDEALIELTEKFDRCTLETLKIPNQALIEAYNQFDEVLIEPLKIAKNRIEDYHSKIGLSSWQKKDSKGTILGQKITPINRIGVYIPGGTAHYPSSVLMTIIPAIIAGVKEIAVVSPPLNNGLPAPIILATLHLLNIKEVYPIGGAQAIAALALGTKTISAVDKIVGPGNKYVAEAKRQVYGIVGIDIPAGPSEILIYCNDNNIDPKIIAIDLLAQAEHDPNSKVTLITQDESLAKKISDETIPNLIKEQTRRSIIQTAIDKFGQIIVVKDDDQASSIINQISPEHLQLLGTSEDFIDKIKNTGAIFNGIYSSAVVGDYMAGPNHTLPTMGMARFTSGLSTLDFLKASSYTEFSETTFKELAPRIIRLAELEKLYTHAEAIKLRLLKD